MEQESKNNPGKKAVEKNEFIKFWFRQFFLPPFSNTLLLYLCFAHQMALLGFYHDCSLSTSAVTSIHAGACDDRHCEKESGHGRGT